MSPRFLSLWMAHWIASLCWGGGLINLNNNFTPPGSSSKAYVLGWDGQPLAKHLGRIEVLDSTGALIRSGGFGANGLFFLGVTEIPGTVPGGSGFIIIRVWDSSTGDSYDTATFKLSAIVILKNLGGGDSPPSGLATGSNFVGLFPALTPPWLFDDPWAALGQMVFVGDLAVVRGSGTSGSRWALLWSEDLGRWSRIGEPGPAPSPWEGAIYPLEWRIPKPPSDAGFFRVVQDR